MVSNRSMHNNHDQSYSLIIVHECIPCVWLPRPGEVVQCSSNNSGLSAVSECPCAAVDHEPAAHLAEQRPLGGGPVTQQSGQLVQVQVPTSRDHCLHQPRQLDLQHRHGRLRVPGVNSITNAILVY